MAGSFLYDPNSNYGYKPIPGPWGQAKSYLGTYAGGLDAETNPEAYFTHYLGTLGLGGTDYRSNAARNLYGRVSDAYGAARLKNNELTWRDYLGGLDINTLLNQQSSQQLGLQPSNVVPFDVRWLPRV